MSALSDRIAAEHRRIWNTVWITCRCGWSNTEPPVADQDVFIAHVADFTERAVRDTAAESIEADMNHDANRNATLATAARIAREGTTP